LNGELKFRAFNKIGRVFFDLFVITLYVRIKQRFHTTLKSL
jgi:hypothetical protein